MRFPVTIVGGGALGTFFALCLTKAGFPVSLVARGKRLKQLRLDGLRFSDGDGDQRGVCTVSDEPVAAADAALVILAVKSWQVEAVVAGLAGHLTPDAGVLTLQNGVDAPAQVAAVLPHNPVLAGGVHGFFSLDPDGVVRHAGVAPRLIAGVYAEGVASGGGALLMHLRSAFGAAAIACDIVDDIRTELWRKMMLACAVGGLGAAYDRPAGWLRTDVQARADLVVLLGEVAAVARAAGASLGEEDVAANLAFIDRFPSESTTSMQRDIAAGRPSELDAQNGALARWANRLGVPAPVNDRVLDEIGRRWNAFARTEGESA